MLSFSIMVHTEAQMSVVSWNNRVFLCCVLKVQAWLIVLAFREMEKILVFCLIIVFVFFHFVIPPQENLYESEMIACQHVSFLLLNARRKNFFLTNLLFLLFCLLNEEKTKWSWNLICNDISLIIILIVFFLTFCGYCFILLWFV